PGVCVPLGLSTQRFGPGFGVMCPLHGDSGAVLSGFEGLEGLGQFSGRSGERPMKPQPLSAHWVPDPKVTRGKSLEFSLGASLGGGRRIFWSSGAVRTKPRRITRLRPVLSGKGDLFGGTGLVWSTGLIIFFAEPLQEGRAQHQQFSVLLREIVRLKAVRCHATCATSVQLGVTADNRASEDRTGQWDGKSRFWAVPNLGVPRGISGVES